MRCALAALATALMLDITCGEPPAAVHPVVGIGRAISWLEQQAPRSRRGQLACGGVLAVGVPLAAAAGAAIVDRVIDRLPLPLRVLALGAALKPAFAIRALLAAGRAVECDLDRGDLVAARAESAALVSRDTAGLASEPLAAAAIESLAENLTDSIAAPLLAFALAGLPGAYWYRAVNTLDSMIGYRGRYEWLGKAAARLDDMANFVPARIAAVLLVVAAPLAGGSARRGVRSMLAEHGRTASPNAGWTMAAAAGTLHVRLEKQGHYVLNADGLRPTPADIAAARRLVAVAAAVAAASAAACIVRRTRSRA